MVEVPPDKPLVHSVHGPSGRSLVPNVLLPPCPPPSEGGAGLVFSMLLAMMSAGPNELSWKTRWDHMSSCLTAGSLFPSFSFRKA